MSRRDWLCSVVAWDGCLPLLVVLTQAMLPVVLPNRVLAELSAFIGVPLAAALLRAHHGCCHLQERGCGAALSRQLMFGCAIVCLLLFEGLIGMLHFAAGAPFWISFAAGGLYLVYLGVVVAVLRPRDVTEREPNAETAWPSD
jgi:hypothetical protein